MAAEASCSSGTTAATAQRKRFSTSDDIFLLRDVIARNPFEDPTLWDAVVIALNEATRKGFTLRAVKDRLELLLKLFKAGDRINLRKSGTEEQYNEKERLLQEAVDLQKEFGDEGGRPRPQSKAAAKAVASAARAEAMDRMLQFQAQILPGQDESAREILEGLCQEEEESSNEHGPEEEAGEVACTAAEVPATPSVRSRGLVQPVGVTPAAATPQRQLMATRGRKRNLSLGLEYLQSKAANKFKLSRAEQELKRMQMQLEERRLKLAEDGLQLERDKLEMEKRKLEMEADLARRKQTMEEEKARRQADLGDQQAALLNMLIQKLLSDKDPTK